MEALDPRPGGVSAGPGNEHQRPSWTGTGRLLLYQSAWNSSSCKQGCCEIRTFYATRQSRMEGDRGSSGEPRKMCSNCTQSLNWQVAFHHARPHIAGVPGVQCSGCDNEHPGFYWSGSAFLDRNCQGPSGCAAVRGCLEVNTASRWAGKLPAHCAAGKMRDC